MSTRQNNSDGKFHSEELNERKRKILWAVVQDYADTAEPVGSRTIARKYELGISSATIRNEMQDLEDEGYLEQPHASAGRVPSIKGYRFYVDRLMKPDPMTAEEKDIFNHELSKHTTKIDGLFKHLAKVIARLTHTLSVAAVSSGEKRLFNYIRFLPLDGKRAILLAVTDRGDVTNVIVSIPQESSFDELQLLADHLNHFLHGREVEKADENLILSFRSEVERDVSAYMPILTALRTALRPKRRVYSGGASQLIEQPEFHSVEKVQDILHLLEERDILESMLHASMDTPIAVHIGTENELKSLSDLSIIRAQFTFNDEIIGSVAVLGPTRMQYSRVIGMMRFMQQRLDALLRGE